MKTVKDMKPGQKFMLCRNGRRYIKIGSYTGYRSLCKILLKSNTDWHKFYPVHTFQATLHNNCHVYERS